MIQVNRPKMLYMKKNIKVKIALKNLKELKLQKLIIKLRVKFKRIKTLIK